MSKCHAMLKMCDVLSVCNVLLLESFHALSLKSVILLQRQFVLSSCSLIVLKAFLFCLREVLVFQKDTISRSVMCERHVILSICNLKLSELHSILFVCRESY